MSKLDKPFVELALEGSVLLEEIDDFIDLWHENDTKRPLYKFLGMNRSEYSLWVSEPGMLPQIITARREERSLSEVIEKDYDELRLAARSADKITLKHLRQWLDKQD